jgi:hypothetical protein
MLTGDGLDGDDRGLEIAARAIVDCSSKISMVKKCNQNVTVQTENDPKSMVEFII